MMKYFVSLEVREIKKKFCFIIIKNTTYHLMKVGSALYLITDSRGHFSLSLSYINLHTHTHTYTHTHTHTLTHSHTHTHTHTHTHAHTHTSCNKSMAANQC